MEETLAVLNEMRDIGLLKKYALAGGIAALYYMEPVLTYDLDVFVILPDEDPVIITLSPIYDYAKKNGYPLEGEHIVIEGIPVQFIPAYNELVREAVEKARKIKYIEVETQIVGAEFLLAIMLQTYRPKDRERILMFLDEVDVNMKYLENILRRYELWEKWSGFRRRYYER